MFKKINETERQKHIERITAHLKSKGWTVDAYGYLSTFKPNDGIKLRVVFKQNIMVRQIKCGKNPWLRNGHAKLNVFAL